jgi:amino acid adenylation domain-containing protein
MMRLDRLVTPIASRTPDRLAVDGPDESLTYGELDRLANRFARTLLESGVEPGARVGIHLPRSGRTIAAMLGTLRAGAIYVPLDPASPPARLEIIARDAGLSCVVTSRTLSEIWNGHARVVLATSVDAAEAAPASAPSRSPDDLAYLLYTSGSTGTPKGVMLSHRNALAFVDWAEDLIDLGPCDRVASVAPFHFDLSVFDIWASLSCGATLVIVDEATVISGPKMLERIYEKAITVWYSVPTAIMLMLDAGRLADRGAPSLRTVFFAGEVFPIRQLKQAMEAIPTARFFNLFGPTETNVCAAYEVLEPPPADATAIPIGRPSCDAIATIVDPAGNPVPDGEVGELLIDGPTVMLGYWDGGLRTPAKRPYPTGDLVSRDADGQLMFHGRRDHMVKIHGFRVELREVEAALLEHPLVREAIVTVRDKELFAIVVPADPALSVLDVKRHCARRLPKYMVPYGVRLVPNLPRTSSGKTDRVEVQRQEASS